MNMNDVNKYPTCASCELCVQINCHPNNKIVGNGVMSDKLGYVCMLWIDNNPKVGFGIFMDDNLGTCECHTPK